MFANCSLGGVTTGFGDACRTPVPPIPYPNIALGPMTIPVCFNLLIMGCPAHNLMSVRPISLGDIPGIGLGMISQTVAAVQTHFTGTFTLIKRGTPATRVTSIGISNWINVPAVCTAPGQCKIIYITA